MKSILSLAALVALVACSSANAASLSVVTTANTHAVYLDGAAQNGTFNTVIVSATPTGSATFLNQNTGLSAGLPRPAGQAFTYRNRILDADPTDPEVTGGLGWSMLGVVSTATEFKFTGGPLGGQISTTAQPNGRLFLANFNMSAGGAGSINVKLVNATGAQVGPDLVTPMPVPEPTSVGLAGMALLGLAAFRRRVA